MKVSVDGIISTARRMKGQNQIEDEPFKKRKDQIGSDSVEITKRINSRLLSIQKELNTIQSKLTKDQIIKEGINQIAEDMINGGEKQDSILNELKFGDERVLADFIGKEINEETLNISFNRINKLIEEDTSSLKKLQIEVENILASNLAGEGVQEIIKDIETIISETDTDSLRNISDLNPKMVMNLIN